MWRNIKTIPDTKNSTTPGRILEIPGYATAVEPCKFSAMFPIYDLVKIRQTGKVDIIVGLILSERGYINNRRLCKGITDLNKHTSCTSLCDIKRDNIQK